MSNTKEQDKKTFTFNGFSWMALFFAPNYYAGYGELKKGLIFAGVSGFIPFSAFFINVYAALKAKDELPIGEQSFDWKPALLVAAFQSVILIIMSLVINSLFFSLPSCDSSDTESTIEKIVGSSYQFKKLGGFVSLKDVDELGFNNDKQVRSCSGKLVTTSGEYNVQYSLKWSNKDQTDFYVELRTK